MKQAIKKSLLEKKISTEKSWTNFLEKNINNPLLEKVGDIPSFYRTYSDAQLIAIIPSLPQSDPKSFSYYSCPSLKAELNESQSDLMPRLAPAFLFDNFKSLEMHGKEIFNLNKEHLPNFSDINFLSQLNNRFFVFDSEESMLYTYQNGKYSKSIFFEDMVEHIVNNPYILFFQGCDDGHVGLRFSCEKDIYTYLESLTVFEDVFKLKTKDFQKTLLQIKKETPEQSVSEFFRMHLEAHN